MLKSKLRLLVDGGLRGNRQEYMYQGQSFDVKVGSTIEIQVYANDGDGLRITEKSDIRFIATAQVHHCTLGMTQLERTMSYHKICECFQLEAFTGTTARLRFAEIWISEVRTRTEEERYVVKPDISSHCGLPTNISSGCPLLKITVSQSPGSATAEQVCYCWTNVHTGMLECELQAGDQWGVCWRGVRTVHSDSNLPGPQKSCACEEDPFFLHPSRTVDSRTVIAVLSAACCSQVPRFD